MNVPVGNPDRAKASEHAIVLVRDLHVPIGYVMRTLPSVAERVPSKLLLNLTLGESTSALPFEMAIKYLPDESRWLLTLRCRSKHSMVDFFDGEIRLDEKSTASTELTLIGRFIFPKTLIREHLEEAALRTIAEQNLTHVFESLLVEIVRRHDTLRE